MWLIAGCLFLAALGAFLGIMRHDPRTLWSGAACFWMLFCLAVCLLFVLEQYAQWLQAHEAVIGALAFLTLLAVAGMLGLPSVLILVFFVEGVRVIVHEGRRAANFLSLLFSVLLCVYLIVWPLAGGLAEKSAGTLIYGCVSFLAAYALARFHHRSGIRSGNAVSWLWGSVQAVWSSGRLTADSFSCLQGTGGWHSGCLVGSWRCS